MFNSIIKRTLLVCIGFLCLLNTPNIQAEPSIVSKANAVQPIYHGENDIIVTITGLEILIESDQGGNIILAADLYDSTQQVVLSKGTVTPVNSMSLDIRGLSSGYYILQVQTTTEVESFQINL